MADRSGFRRRPFFIVLILTSFFTPGLPFLAAQEDLEEEVYAEFGFSGVLQQKYKLIEEQVEPKTAILNLQLNAMYLSKNFDLVIKGSLRGDAKYDGSDEMVYLEKVLQGQYLFMDEGYTAFHTGSFEFELGRKSHRDEVRSPYSLFIGGGDNPVLLGNMRYETDFFFFNNRWVSLNARSRNVYTGSQALSGVGEYLAGYPKYADGICWADRGMIYRTFGFHAGDFKFGFQDTVIYLGREFAPEYFFNPLPMFLAQIITANPGRPWGEYANTSSLYGGFVEYDTPKHYIVGQFLLDDVNLSFLPGVSASENVNKVAWSFGGRKQFSFGRLGFFHAGATKYTFQATYAKDKGSYSSPEDFEQGEVPLYYNFLPYEYTYYPASTYPLEDGTLMPVHYADNYIGYKYGENNLAFMVDYENDFFRGSRWEFGFYNSLEWVINGAKSPNNPWFTYHDPKPISGIFILFDDTVEHLLVNSSRFSKSFNDFFLYLDVKFGCAFNAMTLTEIVPDEARAFVPQSGVHEPVFEMSLGGLYSVNVVEAAQKEKKVTTGYKEEQHDPLIFTDEDGHRHVFEKRTNGKREEPFKLVIEREFADEELESRYRIVDVDYHIEGKTKEHLIDLYLEFDEKKVFVSKKELAAYLLDQQQKIINKRVFHTGWIEAKITETETGPYHVQLDVYTVDTNNIFVLPYFKYDSNEGLLLSLRGRDYNFLGSMLPLRLNLDYWNTVEGYNEVGLETTLTIPFRKYGRDWEYDTSQAILFSSGTGLAFDWDNDVSLFLEFWDIRWQLKASQDYSLEGEGDADDYYFTSGVSFGGSIPTGLFIGDYELSYRPSISNSVDYKLEEPISCGRRGVESTFSHSLSFGQIDWKENFREGFRISVSNSELYNYYKDDWDIGFDGTVQGHAAWSAIGINSRLKGFYKIDAVEDEAGDVMRGIMDDRIQGDAGVSLNLDLPFNMWVWFMSKWFYGQLAPFFDMAVVRPEGGSFDFADAWYSAGFEGFAYLKKARSIYLRVSLGIDMEAMFTEGGLRDPAPRDGGSRYEIYIGFGHHY